MLKFILGLLYVGLSSGQILQNGLCDQNVALEQNFSIDRFTGKWYSIEGTVSPLQAGDCSYIEINPASTAAGIQTFDVYLRSINQNFLEEINGDATVQGQTASISMNLPAVGKIIDFNVMITNYDNYALAYSCENVGTTSRNIYIWKLGRDTSFPAEMIVNLMNQAIYTNFNLTSADLTVTEHSENACYELPVIPPGQAVILPGQCDPNTTVVQNFGADQFQGIWHQIASYYTPNSVGTCNRAEYTLRGSVVDVVNSEVVSQRLTSISGNAVISSSDGSARLLVTLEVAPNVNIQSPLWILATDYLSYAVSYTCVDLPNDQKQVNSWILSRTRQMTAAAQLEVDRVIRSYLDLNDRYFIQSDQTNAACFYYPDPVPDQSVIFGGQCDEDIPVVPNFRVADYLGVWHTIEAYPSENALGSCGNAQYTLGDGGKVDVYNTEVINQTLFTIDGTAELASTDGSAKLSVTFPISGTNFTISTNYWVLATDYDSYALVYSCNNINPDQKIVFSWKLSRTKQLPTNAASVIEQTMRDIAVLDQRYFQKNDQSDVACFYYPEPQPGVPVVFRGQCDDYISTVDNFNAASFIGTWYEIEAYPKENQPGQCINHVYSLSSAGLNIVSRSVDDEFLIVTDSIAAVNGTSGRLSITIPANGSAITIPFWILAADYNDFALAYSCVNINPEQRAVYSWKLSRTRTLSSTANSVIANQMNAIQVLSDRYYERIDQTDTACFYLPDLSPEEPVILPGQCDQNIPVVRDFNAARYAGRWRLIESYLQEFQTGTCIDATYTLLDNGTVLVHNSQVINQALNTIDGTAVLASNDGSGKLLVTFPNSPQAADYWILDTDYDSYALVYSCRNLANNQRRVNSWKLSRTRQLSPAANNNINNIINTIDVLNSRYYQSVDNSDAACFYYPVPDGRPPIFRGQCDENIPVASNFNAANYLNTWYDIESYPTQFQFGTCPSATYTLNGTVVDVYNTEVVNQVLSYVYGVAVPYPDGSARFDVSFPIPGTGLSTNSPYWVLATDYDNYALVYSCTNIDDERRSVYSWKLSRTKSLSAESTTAINNVLNTIPVLRQQYYEVRGHTEEDCFYYPDNKGGPVILEGECAPSTIAVPNFSSTLFAGTWYEITRFPSELKSGECVSNEYVALPGQNSFNLTKSFITYEKLNLAIGSASLSADGRGILDVKLTDDNGDSYETTMYIMDVDYDDYALLYSCRNLGNNYKQVYSWKLSRNQAGLSTQATANINRIVSDTRDLFEGYYEDTDQSLDACFYYPEFDGTEQIVLPGPCNDTVRGVANFDAVAYLGKWYEMASYPQPFQDGDCARAYYSTIDGAVVSVMNTQVTNRTLDVAYATAVVASTDGSGVLEVTFNFPGFSTVSNYYILTTDYTNYALVYSCRTVNDGKNRQVSSWKLSRDKTLSMQADERMDAVIQNTQGLRESYYTSTDQSDDSCFYIPEVDRDQAPIFRGQCDNVQGVQGFNAQRYIGWWHEIEAYPTDTDSGSCVSSHFQAVGTTYRVVDTSVRNNNATVIVGDVTVSDNGRLRRTYSDGRVVDIWVLATDYDTYSLLYSCENVNSDYKRIWSAKHSKTRSLSQAAQDAMSEVIANRRVLERQFYLAVDQRDEVCFHYPELTGDQVILPGQCDQNIPVQRQFDAAQYTGTWYQIQRYPQRFESGNCTGARYSLDTESGVVTVLNWQVVDGILDTIEGNAVVSSVDGSARLTVNLPIRTRETEIPMISMELYVLTTDYLSYSLAYSCVNIDPYRRAVATWKLSRTRTMTAAGDAAISTYMANREEFYNNYFITVEQSDECPEPSSAILAKSSIIVLIISIALLYL